jgi:hypothetical protein
MFPLLSERKTAYVSAFHFFRPEPGAYGPCVAFYDDEEKAKYTTCRKARLDTRNQWYKTRIPSGDLFLALKKPMSLQPFPLLHALVREQALSLLFAGDFAGVHEQDRRMFCHEKRARILSLPSAREYCSLVLKKLTSHAPEDVSRYLSSCGAAGIIDEEGVYHLYNPLSNVVILSIHRDTVKDTRLV